MLVLSLGKLASVFNKGCNLLLDYVCCLCVCVFDEASCLIPSITYISEAKWTIRMLPTLDTEYKTRKNSVYCTYRCSRKLIVFLPRSEVQMSKGDFWPTVSRFSLLLSLAALHYSTAGELPASDGAYILILMLLCTGSTGFILDLSIWILGLGYVMPSLTDKAVLDRVCI